ncbi:S16 family serine protease [Bythopirellula polymerisocia]|uniref:endopeptidase La n=1 Tax=Bythopirellula polymerisocia TaxID=2528003 RepID=A0A5C6D181_9BACT|nr:S16 family serine protease [Bythopirellula polymerisocia]TWU29417.1 Lon protease 2 [Bythopirellula polymerisocia]
MKFLGVASILLSILFGTATRNCSAHEEGTEPGDALQSVTVNVYPLAYYDPGPGKKPWGGCDKVPITVGGYPHGTIRVGVFESILGGTGQLWRATSWQAALTASQLLDFDPHAMQVAVSVEGKIDGPSAGALFTVGILPAVRGDQLNEEVTMTGTINPDGTIGPVGGIAYKLEGAAQAGKKTVLIPAFTRLQYDAYSKEHIDLVEHGKKQGLTVHQVNDVWEAYELFTGKKLPRHKEITLPMVSSMMSNHLRERTEKWIELQSRAHKAYSSWDEDRHSDYADDFLEGSEDLMKRSLAATSKGSLPRPIGMQ